MSTYTVKSLKYQLNNIKECVVEYKDGLKKANTMLKVLKAQMKKAPKAYKYLYEDGIKDVKEDIKNYHKDIKDAHKETKSLTKKLPAAIAYEKKHPEAVNDAGYERQRRLHLEKIRGKAVIASKAKALAKKIEKATGINCFAYTDMGQPYVSIRSTVTYLNKMKKEVSELKGAKIEDVYKEGNKMRGIIRLVVK